jgi:hypothetical protein
VLGSLLRWVLLAKLLLLVVLLPLAGLLLLAELLDHSVLDLLHLVVFALVVT